MTLTELIENRDAKFKGKIIVFEGIDGTGKSTQANLLANNLIDMGYQVYNTNTPSANPIGQFIRKQLYSKELKLSRRAMALMFVADMEDLIDKIANEIEEWDFIILDRYFLSTLAYQSEKGDSIRVQDLLNIMHGLPIPDLIFYLDADPTYTMARLDKRLDEKDVYENIEKQRKVYTAYGRILNLYQHHTLFIEDVPIEVLGNEILSIVKEKLLPETVNVTRETNTNDYT